ncbi:MAG: 3-oxo-tetronate kinase [Vulcanimicrobiaceae bacterium]
MALLLGAIADDFTGATDLANTLVRGGMRTIQTIGVPSRDVALEDADAIVVALKSRSIPAEEAVRLSLEALEALRARGAIKFLFKYCSTFDSTDHGNIGPVADALLDRLGSEMTVFCPAFPENGRRVFNGYLFVNDVLLSESGMEKHPITPMADANLVRVLSRQTKHKVARVDLSRVRRGEAAVRTAMMEARATGVRHLVVDAAGDDDLRAIGLGTEELPLVTGGSGIALGLPALFVRLGMLERGPGVDALPHVGGHAVVLSGSCSRATLAQVEYMRARRPAFSIETSALDQPDRLVENALVWAIEHLTGAPILISASAPPEKVAEAQARFGKENAGERIEHVLGALARQLRDRGVRRFVVAGGETSGAVVRELGVSALRIGRQIDPGVPWTETVGSPAIALALKSGNFGSEDFFLRAIELAP